jgi:hypothetical protein
MATNYNLDSYGLSQALILTPPYPIALDIDPSTSNKLVPGTLWCNLSTNAVFVLASVKNNSANWVNIGNGAGNFLSLTVNPGPITLTGLTNINTTGTGSTLIGTGTNIVEIKGNIGINDTGSSGDTSIGNGTSLLVLNGIIDINQGASSITTIGGGSGSVTIGGGSGAVTIGGGVGGVTLGGGVGRVTTNSGLVVTGSPAIVSPGQIGYTGTSAAATTLGTVVQRLEVSIGGTIRYIALYDNIT